MAFLFSLGKFEIFSCLGDTPAGVIILPSNFCLCVPILNLFGDNLSPDFLTLSKIFERVGIISSKFLSALPMSFMNCVHRSAARHGSR